MATTGVVLLWLSAGRTVLEGDALVVTGTFFLCASLCAARSVLRARVDLALVTVTDNTRCIGLTAGTMAVLAVYLMGNAYFAGWAALFTSLYVAGSAGAALVSATVTHGDGKLLVLATLIIGITGVATTWKVWADSGLLGGLLVFVPGFILCGLYFSTIAEVGRPRS